MDFLSDYPFSVNNNRNNTTTVNSIITCWLEIKKKRCRTEYNSVIGLKVINEGIHNN
jgi:hypothetical protein